MDDVGIAGQRLSRLTPRSSGSGGTRVNLQAAFRSAVLRPVSMVWVMALLALPILSMPKAGAQEKKAQPASQVAEKLPEAKEIIDRFVKAIGGKAAFDQIKSQHGKGRFMMAAQGLAGDLEVFASRPNQVLVKIELMGLGTMMQGYDGTVAWSLNPVTGPMLLEGKQLEQMREQADFDSVLHQPEDFKSMETVEKTEFAGKPCYKLKMVRKSGNEVMEYYGVETGLLAGSEMTQDSPVGPLAVTNQMDNYQKYGGVLFATKIKQTVGPIEQVMTIEKFEVNSVDPAVFELPAEIKALVKKP